MNIGKYFQKQFFEAHLPPDLKDSGFDARNAILFQIKVFSKDCTDKMLLTTYTLVLHD